MIKKDIETLDKINYGGIMFEQGRKEREDEIIVLMYQIEQQNKDDYESMWDILFRQIKEKK